MSSEPAEAGLSIRAVLLFIGLIVTWIAVVSILPRTDGFTSLRWCLGTYTLSFWVMSTIIREGQRSACSCRSCRR